MFLYSLMSLDKTISALELQKLLLMQKAQPLHCFWLVVPPVKVTTRNKKSCTSRQFFRLPPPTSRNKRPVIFVTSWKKWEFAMQFICKGINWEVHICLTATSSNIINKWVKSLPLRIVFSCFPSETVREARPRTPSCHLSHGRSKREQQTAYVVKLFHMHIPKHSVSHRMFLMSMHIYFVFILCTSPATDSLIIFPTHNAR